MALQLTYGAGQLPCPDWHCGMLEALSRGLVDVVVLPGVHQSLYDELGLELCLWYTVWCYTWAIPAAFDTPLPTLWR